MKSNYYAFSIRDHVGLFIILFSLCQSEDMIGFFLNNHTEDVSLNLHCWRKGNDDINKFSSVCLLFIHS